MSQLQDFPIGFAEQINHSNDQQNDTVFYVEWFDNASEFPGLASATTKSDLQGGNWELLQRKETNMDDDEEHTLHPLKEDASWSHLDTKQSEKPYAQVAEDAAELGPCKRTVKPLWSNIANKKNEKKLVIVDNDEGDNYDDLYYSHKYQSRRANHLMKRQRVRDFRIIDLYIEGFFKVATSHNGKFTIVAQDLEHNYYASCVNNSKINTKASALRYTNSFLGDPKPWRRTYENKKDNTITDVAEYSVLDPILR